MTYFRDSRIKSGQPKKCYNKLGDRQASDVSSDPKGPALQITIEERSTSISSILSTIMLQVLFESYTLGPPAIMTDVLDGLLL